MHATLEGMPQPEAPRSACRGFSLCPLGAPDFSRKGRGAGERADEEAEYLGERPGVSGEAEPEKYGEGERPLAVWGPGQHAFDEVQRGVVRPAGVAGGGTNGVFVAEAG